MVVIQLLHEILRPGDVVLVNAHLAPLDENIDPEKSANLQMDHLKPAMEKVLPQYDNPETHAWLNAAVDQWKLGEFVEEVRIGWGLMRRLPVIYGAAHWRSLDLYRRWCSKPSWADPSLRLFRSLRYTPELFENMLNDAGLSAKLLAITACREEAIWVVRKK
jgi:hypothetical protein